MRVDYVVSFSACILGVSRLQLGGSIWSARNLDSKVRRLAPQGRAVSCIDCESTFFVEPAGI